ncbi:MAG: extracellular solute-binding protein [Actinomycetota bacterium]|nr:extracellular solute-binding protein [Actinomycetota bacterium]
MRRLTTAALAGTFVFGLLVALPMAPSSAADGQLVIWADQLRADVIKAQFPDGFKGTKLNVVVKESLAAIEEQLKSVKPEDGPDVIAAEHTSTGALVQAKLVRRLTPGKAVASLFPANVLNGFRYNSRTYGIPIQFENLAMVTNTALVPKQPKTFAKLTAVAKRLLATGKATAGVAVGQGDAGNAYNMYPFFSGLGGYALGVDAKGNVNPSDVGVANPTFLGNSGQIKQWNADRVIDSSMTTAAAKDVFAAGKAPFWITGPWDLNSVVALPFGYRITAVPSMVQTKATSPLLGMKGFMVTVFAQGHQMRKEADRFLTEGIARAGVQAAFATAARRMPANRKAASGITDLRLRAFGSAGTSGVAIPNVPQMQDVWGPLGTAWQVTTKGGAATAPVPAFTDAQAKVVAAIAARS